MLIESRIINIIKKSCALYEKKLNITTAISALSLDSLSFIQLAVNLEQEFDIFFEAEELNIRDYLYVQDIIHLVEEKINEKPSL